MMDKNKQCFRCYHNVKMDRCPWCKEIRITCNLTGEFKREHDYCSDFVSDVEMMEAKRWSQE